MKTTRLFTLLMALSAMVAAQPVGRSTLLTNAWGWNQKVVPGNTAPNYYLRRSFESFLTTVDDLPSIVTNTTSYNNPSWISSLNWAKLTGKPTTLSGYGITDGVSSTSSYTNPSWISSLPWSKMYATPTTLSGYGITDAKRSHEIYTVGDSFFGSGLIQAALSSSINTSFTFVNYGVPGNTTTDIRNRYSAVINGDAEIVMILCSINDIAQGTSSTTIVSNIQAMVTEAKAMPSSPKVILLTTGPFAGNVSWTSGKQTVQDQVNNAIMTPSIITGADARVNIKPYLETAPGSNTLSPSLDSGDKLHPNATGYGVIANVTYSVAASMFTLSTSAPAVSFGKSISLSQSLDPLSRPVFKGLWLNDSLKCGVNSIFANNATLTGALSANSLFSAANSTVTGVQYAYNSYQLGLLGVNGAWTTGGTAMKFVPGSGFPDMRLCTYAAPNGRFEIISSTGNMRMGDIPNLPADDGVNLLQLGGSAKMPVLNLTAVTGFDPAQLNFTPLTSANSVINFKQSSGTVRGFIDMNISTGAFRMWGQSGGYYLSFGSNGSERMTIDASGNIAAGVGSLATSSTNGFLYISTCSGAPTGTPTAKTGMVPMMYDATNNKLYIYNGGWKSVTLN